MEGVLAYSIAGARKVLGDCGRTKIYQMIGDGRLDAKKLDGKTIITHSSLVRAYDDLPTADIGKPTKDGPKDEPQTAA